jgi:hypothetical protein
LWQYSKCLTLSNIQFNSIQFILLSSDPRGVFDPQDIEHVN